MVNDRLTIHETPFGLWLFLLVFAGIPPAVYFYNFPVINLQGVLVLIYTGFLVIAMLTISVLTITADRSMAELTLDYRSVLTHSIKKIPYYDILSIDVVSRRSSSHSGSSTTFQVLINTRSNGSVPLRSYSSSGAGSKVRLAQQLREFIGVGGQDQTSGNIFNTAREIINNQMKEVSLAQAGSDNLSANPAARNRSPDQGGIGDDPTMQPTRQKVPQAKIYQGQMNSGIAMTRWVSDEFLTNGIFLFMAQNPPKQAFGGGEGWLSSLGEVIFRQAFKLYGFADADAPDADHAQLMSLNSISPLLAQDFTALSNFPDAAYQYLTPRTIQPLVEWSQTHPMHSSQATGGGQLVVLIGPRGVSFSIIGSLSPDLPDELSRIGTKFVQGLL